MSPSPDVRVEHDTLGPVPVPAERLWGAQTQRALETFRISDERMPLPLVRALALVKKATARANVTLNELEEVVGRAIEEAAEEVLRGEHDGEFPLLVWQSGSGTQTHMNVNEVVANRASEILGGERGDGERGTLHGDQGRWFDGSRLHRGDPPLP